MLTRRVHVELEYSRELTEKAYELVDRACKDLALHMSPQHELAGRLIRMALGDAIQEEHRQHEEEVRNDARLKRLLPGPEGPVRESW